jgi:hypothetical protein
MFFVNVDFVETTRSAVVGEELIPSRILAVE